MKRDNTQGLTTIVFIHIFIQVPLNQFPGYVAKLVGNCMTPWRQWLMGDSRVNGHFQL